MNDDQALRDFVAKYARPYDPESDDYDRPPFTADIKEGKNDPIYNAHSYHTKVPPRGIIPYILHYTRPGDLILDPFCGSGMTGVAAQMCANPPADYVVMAVPATMLRRIKIVPALPPDQARAIATLSYGPATRAVLHSVEDVHQAHQRLLISWEFNDRAVIVPLARRQPGTGADCRTPGRARRNRRPSSLRSRHRPSDNGR